jgi:hypothetical protein
VDCVLRTQSTPVRNNPIQTNFTAGELTPRLKGRVDVNKYQNGVQILKNFIIMPQGGVYRRPGTKFINEVKDSSKFTRLIPFEFSTIQAYVLEFGDLYIRIYRDGGLVVDGNGDPIEVVTPYTADDLRLLQFTQSADVLYIVHPGYKPRKLSRTAHTNWTLTEIDFKDGPYLSLNKTSTTITASHKDGTGRTITASSGIFSATDVGRLIRKEDTAKWGYAKITAYNSPTSVTVDILGDFHSTSATADWRLGAWSQTTGWPGSVVFFQERLVFAYTDTQPQTIWMSCAGDYENFQPTGVVGEVYPADSSVNDDNAITYTIASNKVNAIRWMDAASNLVVGTAGAEWIAKQATNADPLSPTNIQVLQQTTYGSDAVPARRVGNATLFIQRSGRRVRELVYNFDVDAYIARDLSILSEHLLRENNYTVDNAYQAEPDSVFWLVTETGKLIGMTYLREQEVVGFHQHEFGGSFNGGSSVVESISVIPNPDLTGDQLWLIIKRTINGETKRYVELLQEAHDPIDPLNKDNMWYLDSALTTTVSTPETIFSGLDHLKNETVGILADGASRPQESVNLDGLLTLQRSASTVIVGLPYMSIIKTLPGEGGGQAGTAQGKQARISKVGIRVLNSLSFKIGTTLSNLFIKEFRQTTDKMDASPPLFSGDKFVSLDQGYTTDTSYYIVQDLPYPLTVLALMPESVVYK